MKLLVNDHYQSISREFNFEGTSSSTSLHHGLDQNDVSDVDTLCMVLQSYVDTGHVVIGVVA